jgi:RHS repeat-associated protein
MVVNESKPNSGNGTELRPVPTLDVWFDDIEVVHTEALIVQENHYDPYGLSLSGIEKENKPEDKWKFQDKELITELDLNWQDFGARFYDPQLGRWHCVDPADQFSSSYVGLGNNPVTAVDPDGRLAFLPILIGAAIGGVFNLAIKASQGQIGSFKDGLVAFGIGAAGGAVTAATGGAVAGVLGLPATGVISGAVTGAAGSAVGGPVTGIGNSVYFGDSYSSKDWGTGIVTGGVIGGATGGVAALIKGNNFWTGAPRGINPITGSKSNPFSFKNGDYLEENGWQRLSIGKWGKGTTEGDQYSEFPKFTAPDELGGGNTYTIRNVNGSDARAFTGGWASEIDLHPVNANGVPYPSVFVEGYGQVPFPQGPLLRTDTWLREEFTQTFKNEFRRWWVGQGRPWPTPSQGSVIDIHHIKPLGFGGINGNIRSNDFSNLVPLDRITQHRLFNSWWSGFRYR